MEPSHKVWLKYYPNDPVRKGECIHHLNGDHEDNRKENLCKMTLADHTRTHQYYKLAEEARVREMRAKYVAEVRSKEAAKRSRLQPKSGR
jgi:hypothetical protein